MKTLNSFIYLFIFLLITIFSGCQDLDYDEATGNDKNEIFQDFTNAKRFVVGIYDYLPSGFNVIGNSMRACATDEAQEVNVLSSINKFNDGSWSSLQTLDNVWPTMYTAIRACNLYLIESEGQTFSERRFTNTYKDEMLQFTNFEFEVRFLRAFFYFELIKRYKDVPLITKVLTTDEAKIATETEFKDVVDFIVKECDASRIGLQDNYTSFATVNETGRATKGAAMALKARVLLYAASPLHNPHPVGSDEYKQLWVKAALASKDIIDYKLNNNPVYTLPSVYTSIFNNINTRELIFECREAANNGFERRNFPAGLIGATPGTCPTQNLVDAYEMASSGLPITEDIRYNPQQPYSGRDSRMRSTIINNATQFKGNTIELFLGGKNALPQPNASRTGYYLRKYLREETNLDPNVGTVNSFDHHWVLFRYAEVLLNYAEAMNEAFGPNTIGTMPAGSITATVAVNQVRRRAQMPNFPATLDENAFREKLRNERRVELAFEDHRFWDVRRWKIGDQTKDIYAMKVTGTKTVPVYEKVLLEKRIFDKKMNLYPKSQSELIRNKNLKQNPDW